LFPADLVIGDLHAELVEIDENFKVPLPEIGIASCPIHEGRRSDQLRCKNLSIESGEPTPESEVLLPIKL
jgi:hypothetical protein